MPAEWVTIIPGQIAREKLKGDDVQEMLDLACRSPALNAQSIVTAGRNALQLDNNPLIGSFGISVDKSLITVRGRVLTCPTITYAKSQRVIPRAGSWNMSAVKVLMVSQDR